MTGDFLQCPVSAGGLGSGGWGEEGRVSWERRPTQEPGAPGMPAEVSSSLLEPWLSQALTCLPHHSVLPLHLASSPNSVMPQILPFSLWKGQGRAQGRPRTPLGPGHEKGEARRRRGRSRGLREETETGRGRFRER